MLRLLPLQHEEAHLRCALPLLRLVHCGLSGRLGGSTLSHVLLTGQKRGKTHLPRLRGGRMGGRKISLSHWPGLDGYHQEVSSSPTVRWGTALSTWWSSKSFQNTRTKSKVSKYSVFSFLKEEAFASSSFLCPFMIT